MARKLRSFVTSLGFFEQAVAAPSMKGALEAWGSVQNLFQQGLAKETDDPAIVRATMAKPGVVLKRALGSGGPFTENAQLPKTLPREISKGESKPVRDEKAAGRSSRPNVVNLADARAAKRAAEEFEKQRARRLKEEEKNETARRKERERRDAEVSKAKAALEDAEKRHDEAMDKIAAERAALDRRAEIEEARWQKEKEKLQALRDRI
jgi:colicin import membrane protein